MMLATYILTLDNVTWSDIVLFVVLAGVSIRVLYWGSSYRSRL